MKSPQMGNANTIPIAVIAGFFLGAVAVGGVWAFVGQPAAAVKALRESDIPSGSSYQYIDPLIGLSSSGTNSSTYASLEQFVDSYIASEVKDGVSQVSVKFSDIEQAAGFTIDPTEQYYPASLDKVPVMMAYYSLAEQDPAILDQELVYTGVSDSNDIESVKSPVQLVPGQSYTVEQLIEHMIRYSDNNALDLLWSNLSKTGHFSTLTDLYSSLGVSFGSPDDVNDFMTVQDYSLFLRVLFNATYLDRDYSEKALSIMTQTDFAQGIESGVPNGISVAQKFGEANVAQGGTIVGNEFHNCGIVYYPSHPYLLCVMTKGTNEQALESAIAGISQRIFQAVEGRYPSDTQK